MRISDWSSDVCSSDLPRFIRIWVDHIARTFQSDEMRVNFFTYVNKLLAPFIADRGFDWELHVDETPSDLWTIQGYFPPREGTEDEKRWMSENKAWGRTPDCSLDVVSRGAGAEGPSPRATAT